MCYQGCLCIPFPLMLEGPINWYRKSRLCGAPVIAPSLLTPIPASAGKLSRSTGTDSVPSDSAASVFKELSCRRPEEIFITQIVSGLLSAGHHQHQGLAQLTWRVPHTGEYPCAVMGY